MKVWIFVEGKSDVQALSALWSGWKQNLSTKGWGIQLIPLESKSNYFRKIGSRATEKLANDACDLVVGLPHLYPNRDYADTEYKHNNLQELQGVQTRLIKQHLQQQMGRRTDIGSHITRFYASACETRFGSAATCSLTKHGCAADKVLHLPCDRVDSQWQDGSVLPVSHRGRPLPGSQILNPWQGRTPWSLRLLVRKE